jgi:hypothetical protein
MKTWGVMNGGALVETMRSRQQEDEQQCEAV